ncbi:ABC transporter ATP-binding protein [Thermaerobacter composti]|uniref:ABC transporter ATP-binding protein n=1 Tax=Thermaerobacter composti TaxID=554949 RepID=A0ABZ0QM77_9FIRM|nr:ABC transporter ATP-binding protein [Thermaerobacter composti]WPD18531.1 ABC transporter ATP-binding protein [Thermaerobacter composti]
MSLLRVEDVHTYYGESHVLHGVNLTVEGGQVTAIVGRNGVGKTTLIRSIMGMTPPRRGTIRLEGREIQRLPPHEIARAGVGLVPQGRRIFPSLTVMEHLRVASRAQPEGWTIDAIFELFPQLKNRVNHYGSQLSGGEQSMLSIARALVTNPRILLMDEPTEGLAPLVVEEVGRTVARLAGSGLTVLLVEQNLPLALKLAHKVYVMSKGVIVFEGTPSDLIENHEVRQQHLGV